MFIKKEKERKKELKKSLESTNNKTDNLLLHAFKPSIDMVVKSH